MGALRLMDISYSSYSSYLSPSPIFPILSICPLALFNVKKMNFWAEKYGVIC